MKYWIALFCLLLSSISLSFAQDVSTPYEIALERIAEAEVTGAIQLGLSELGLTDLPPEIGQLSNLQELYLGSNQLSNLPPEIAQLENLQELSLWDNQLSSLPPELWQLSNLQVLNLGNNQLDSLPPEIGNLSYLLGLNLSHNQLHNLPDELGDLEHLCQLGIDFNQFLFLPSFLGDMPLLAEQNYCYYYYNMNNFTATGNPLIDPPQEILDQGRFAILAYLRNRPWYLRSFVIKVTSGAGFLALVILGLRWHYRTRRKPKQKREEL